jgi:hypothetical protein
MAEQPDPPALARGAGADRFPVPDPTTLTTEALRREIDALKELLTQAIDGVRREGENDEKRIDQRHDALRVEFEQRIASAMSFCDGQFHRIAEQLLQVENLRVEQKKDTKDAVDAALTAQKDAVAKSEASTTKQIEQLIVNATTSNDSLRRSIDEVKERVGDVDKKVNIVNATARGGELTRTSLFGWLAAAVAILTVIVVIANVLSAKGL